MHRQRTELYSSPFSFFDKAYFRSVSQAQHFSRSPAPERQTEKTGVDTRGVPEYSSVPNMVRFRLVFSKKALSFPPLLLRVWSFVRQLIEDFLNNDAFTLGAALAYYTVFSFAPMLLVASTVASYFFGEEVIQGRLDAELSGLLGTSAADTLQQLISNAYRSGDTIWASMTGIGTLIFAATGVFNSLRNNLNRIWDIQPAPTNGFVALVLSRVLSFSFVIGLGFLLMITLVINALVIGFMDQLAALVPGLGPVMLATASWMTTTLINTLIFLLIFRYLPDARVAWRDLWAGAIFTALLFGGGRFLIGYYIGNSDFSSTYGAAAALITLLVWTYYNSLIMFLGATFTRSWATWQGRAIFPNSQAVKVRRAIVEIEDQSPVADVRRQETSDQENFR